jgi:hypothetical protein
VTLKAAYLIEFAPPSRDVPWLCAVTAYDADDAMSLVAAAFRPDGSSLPEVTEVLEGVTFDDVKERVGAHGGFGVPVVRGIWYPHIENP